MATVDQSGIVGKIRDLPIGSQLAALLKSAAEATGVDRVFIISGSQPGSSGQSTGSTRHNNGRAADLQLFVNGGVLTFSDANGGQFASFVKACAARGATGIGAGVHYMGNKTIHVGYGTSPQDHSKLVWGANGASANAPQWLRVAAQAGWNDGMESFAVAHFEEDHENAPEPEGEGESMESLESAAPMDTAVGQSSGTCDAKGQDFKMEGASDAEIAVAISKPPIKQFIQARYFDHGRAADINRIVVHYTTSNSVNSTIGEFTKSKEGTGEKKTSSHYVIDRNGDIYQLVRDGDVAYHAQGNNADSIGIEHVAAPGQKLSSAQSASSTELIKWLMQQYDIPKSNILAHKCTIVNGHYKSTDCCGDLFLDYGANRNASCQVFKVALNSWLSANGI